MKKVFVFFLLICVAAFNMQGVYALRFEPPYNINVEEKLIETMPEPFSVDNMEKELVAESDFNSGRDSDTLVYSYGTYNSSNGSGWNEAGGYYKIVKNQTDSSEKLALKYTPTKELNCGDFYAFTCKVKADNVSGGAPLSRLEAYNSKWLAAAQEANGASDVAGSDDWYELTQILKIPDGATYLSLQVALNKSVTGVVYFDDFELYRVAMDPLETVLLSPNYKGLIYGDGYNDIAVDVLVYERGGFYSYDDMSVSVFLTDGNDNKIYSSSPVCSDEKMKFVFSSNGLSEGDYYLKIYLKDKATGDIISEREHTLRKRSADYRPESYVDKNGHFIRNGEKTFIMKLTNWTYNGQNTYLASAQTAKEAGIPYVGHSGLWWANENADTNALDYMRQNQMKTHIKLSSFWYSKLGNGSAGDFISEQTDIPKLFAEITDTYKDDDILDGYYIYDEPNPYTDGEEIRWNNEILAEYDIDHPTYGTADKDYDVYGAYTKMSDILGLDPYPVTGKVDDNGTPIDDYSKTGKYTALLRENFPNRPIIYFMQGFHYTSRGDMRSPNYLELRNMAWQAICEGAEGLSWYAYPEMTMDATKDLETWKNDLEAVTSEVSEYEDVIMSDEPAPLYNVSGGGDWLNISVKRYNGKTYVFTVNNTYENKEAHVRISGAESLDLDFEPLEVKITEIMHDNFLSPEAELLSISFGNGEEVFAVSESNNENTLYVDEDSGVINYSAHISEGAQLVIAGKEMPATGKITVRNAEMFTVKVIAENGITESIWNYRIVKK